MKKCHIPTETTQLKTYFLAFAIIAIVIALITMPQVSLESAKEGLTVCLNVVFPALLPFFIMCELMIGLGIVNFIGALLEPLMRPVFNVPGAGAFAFAMGLSSGYPTGAKISSRLLKDGLITQTEAERLIAFTSTSNPIFMIGAVAVGMYQMPVLGPLIIIAHYLGAIGVGLIMRFYKKNDPSLCTTKIKSSKKNLFKKALGELNLATSKNKKSLGQLLGDAVKISVQSIITIGGFIIFFSVIVGVIKATGISNIFASIMSIFKVPKDISHAILSGIFEMSIGTKAISLTSQTISIKMILTSIILGFGGLSIAAQVFTTTLDTNIKMKPYFSARLLHAVISASIAWFLLNFTSFRNKIFFGVSTMTGQVRSLNFLQSLKISSISTLLTLGIILILAVTSVILFKKKNKFI